MRRWGGQLAEKGPGLVGTCKTKTRKGITSMSTVSCKRKGKRCGGKWERKDRGV